MSKKSLILYGAFDRYNFGDNLMPIVFTYFINKYYPNIENEYNIEYAALFESDLSEYSCLPSKPIKHYFNKAEDESVLIVVGGETLNAKALRLYSFHVDGVLWQKVISRLLKTGPYFSKMIGSWLCGTKFEYPFTPPPEAFCNSVKVCYNSVGGGLPPDISGRSSLLKRLDAACYFSIRDARMLSEITNAGVSVNVVPDSVSAIPTLFDDDFILRNVSDEIRLATTDRYYIFQASPKKADSSPSDTAKVLMEASGSSGVPFILLPIGYAAGHDDRDYLFDVSRRSGLTILDNLNVWEILWVIKSSSAYFGTSLHGAITAMAYQRPHYSIGRVPKLSAYLERWSIEPFSKPRSVHEIPHLISLLNTDYSAVLAAVSQQANDGALHNMEEILRASEVIT